jgi:erythromycin esterase-like protein
MRVPEGRPGSWEDVLHRATGGEDRMLIFPESPSKEMAAWRGHRAIGVVYDPRRESGNYVPTVMGGRYDALVWFEETTAVRPLRHERPPREPELETEPSGY